MDLTLRPIALGLSMLMVSAKESRSWLAGMFRTFVSIILVSQKSAALLPGMGVGAGRKTPLFSTYKYGPRMP